MKAVRDLAAGLGSAGTEAAGDAERQSLRDVQFRQGKAGGDADRAVRTLASLFNAFVYARMGAQVPNEHVLGLFDRRHRATFSRAADASTGTPRGEGEEAGDEGLDADADVFPWSLYREVGAARRERRLFDTGALDKLIAVLDTGVEVADGLAPAAQAAAGGGGAHRRRPGGPRLRGRRRPPARRHRRGPLRHGRVAELRRTDPVPATSDRGARSPRRPDQVAQEGLVQMITPGSPMGTRPHDSSRPPPPAAPRRVAAPSP